MEKRKKAGILLGAICGGIWLFFAKGVFFWIGIAFVVFMSIGRIIYKEEKKKQLANELIDYLNAQIKEVTKDSLFPRILIGEDLESALVLEENKEQITLIYNIHKNNRILVPKHNRYKYVCRTLPYEGILSSTILEDGQIQKQQICNAPTKHMQLQLLINNTRHPLFRISFLALDHAVEKTNEHYQLANREANDWNAVFQVILFNKKTKG